VHVRLAGVDRERGGVGGLDVACCLRELCRVGGDGGVVERVRDQLLGGEGEEVGELDPLNVKSDRVEEHSAADAIVLSHRHLGSDPAADR
jgi:hypothetical protein